MDKPRYYLKRALTPDDHEAVYRMHRKCLPGDKQVFVHQGWWWVLRDQDGNLAGFCGLHTGHQYPGEVGYLVRAGVMPEYRGQGLQRRLIAARERKAKEVGMWGVVTTTYDNPASSNNLMAAGYRQYAPLVPWATEGTQYWRKILLPHDIRVRSPI